MHTLTKVVISSSLVLGAALFSLGCGGGASCCDGNSVNAKVNLLASNNFTSTNTLPANQSVLAVNGLGSTSNSNIVKADWTAYANCTKDTVIDTATATSKDTSIQLDLKTPGQHKVCVVVTDVNGLTDEDCDCITVQELDKPTPVISPAALKPACPLDGSTSVSHSGSNRIDGYKWTVNTLSGSTFATTATSQVPSGANKVCLTVTDSNGETNGICRDVAPHSAPVAVLHVSQNQSGQNEIADGGILNFGDQLNVTCAGSHDDCPLTDGGRSIPQNGTNTNGTCEFNGASYQSTAPDCSVVPQDGVVYTGQSQHATNPATATETATAPYWYRENCKLSGELTQTNNTAGAVSVLMCGTEVFNCVKFWVDVTDEFGGTARAEKTFRVQAR